jgi:hypothetical protein
MTKKTLSPREQQLIDRLKKSGYKFPAVSDDLPISFFVRPTITTGLLRANARIAQMLEDEVHQLIKGKKFTSTLSGLGIFPTIMDPEIGQFADSITYKKDCSVYVKNNINHSKWSAASIPDQVNLLADNVIKSVKQIKHARINEDDRALLIFAIDQARALVLRKIVEMSDNELAAIYQPVGGRH